MAGASIAVSEQMRSAEADPRVALIVSRTIAVDMHNYVQIPYVRIPAHAKPDPALDLAGEMKRSGFSAIIETYAADDLWPTEPDEHYKYHLQALAFEDRFLARNHMQRALNMKDLRTAHNQAQPIIIQSAEGAQFIGGRLQRLEEAYMRGLRTLQPVHELDDAVSPLGDIYTAAGHLGGLTPFGAQVIKECNRLGIVVDLMHGTYEMMKAALKVATQPLIYSHTALKPEPGVRKISADLGGGLPSKELARAVADAGLVIGIWWRLANSAKEYVAEIEDMVDAVGIDHVGIGTDTDITLPDGASPLPYTNGSGRTRTADFSMRSPRDAETGLHADEIGKIGGGNFCRVFAKVTEGRS